MEMLHVERRYTDEGIGNNERRASECMMIPRRYEEDHCLAWIDYFFLFATFKMRI